MCTWSEKRLPLAKEPMPISALYLQHSDTLGGRGSFRSLPFLPPHGSFWAGLYNILRTNPEICL